MVEIEVEKEGFETFRHSFNIASGKRERIWIDLESYLEESPDVVAVPAPMPTGAATNATTLASGQDAATSSTPTTSIYALLDPSITKSSSSAETDSFSGEKNPSPTALSPAPSAKPDDSSQNGSPNKPETPPSSQRIKTAKAPPAAPRAPTRKVATSAPVTRVQPTEPQSKSDESFAGLQSNSERSFDDQGEQEKEKDIFDPLLFEVFSGFSYLLLALGTRPVPDSEEVANLSEQEAQQLASTGIEDWVDIAQGGGATVGTALSLRIDFISLGARLSYSTYGEADVLVFTGEIAQRIQGSVAEFYAGFGFGGGWLYRVPDERITQDSGLAMRLGLGLSFFIARGWTIGIGVDAVGLFLGGDGVSPSQVGDISLTESNHPVGLQVPITLNISPRL